MIFARVRATIVLAGLCALLLAAALAVPATAQDGPVQHARSSTAPGNSTTFTSDSQAAAQASGCNAGVLGGNQSSCDPDLYGPWVDDQREMYWNYETKDATFVESAEACGGGTVSARARVAGLETPKDGVSICWSEYGVPAIFSDDAHDLFYGSGWAAAKLRLFLMEASWRTARGTLAEFAGDGNLEADIAKRYQRYSDDEYRAIYELLSPAARISVDGYVQGVNDYIDWVTTEGRDQMPVEYAALTAEPSYITPEDILALGVEMTRFVASEGGKEMRNVGALRALEATYGTDLGRRYFLDLVWQEDDQAATTITREEGVFPRTSATTQQREAAFDAMADFAATVPLDLATGPGIDTNRVDTDQPIANADPTASASASAAAAAQDALISLFGSTPEGGSYMVMIGPDRTADGSTLLMSEPQLDFDPNVLFEFQLTGAGYNVKGSSVAGIPIVGIGYTPTVAWALTTGNAKTVDSYVETVRADTNDDGAPEYFHDDAWKDMSCRDEVVRYRRSEQGLPYTPAIPALMESVTEQVCRTVHGPVVSWSADGQHALSHQWHMFGREIDTIEAVLRWNQAQTLADIEAATALATWNENIGAVDDQGNIGFWHPGLHLTRSNDSDLRLPIPGTGEYDNGAPLPFDALPHLVNPDRGWIANWNNKPAHGWLDGQGEGSTSYPAGIDARVATLNDIVGSRDDWTFDELIDLDRAAAEEDFRTRHLLDMVLDLGAEFDLTPTEGEAVSLLAAWDRTANGPGADLAHPAYRDDAVTTIGAAATIFEELVVELERDLLGFLADEPPYDFVHAQAYMGRHDYDVSPNLHLALRILDPSLSSIGTAVDYRGGRSASEVLRDALASTVTRLSADQGDDPTGWRSVYFDDARAILAGADTRVCSAARVVGPCGRMWWVERGAWIHHVGFTAASAPATPEPQPEPEPTPGLPATGGGVAVLAVALMALATLARTPVRTRRRA